MACNRESFILWRIDPMLDNGSINIFPWRQIPGNSPLLGKHVPMNTQQWWTSIARQSESSRHVWKLRLHFIFCYLMLHESYGRRTTDVVVSVASLMHRVVWPYYPNRNISIILWVGHSELSYLKYRYDQVCQLWHALLVLRRYRCPWP
jgi:hypothetical protein